jgi:signal transduction histidine kinase
MQMHRTVQALADERASLLEQEERLLHNVSHELRTPVTIARGHLELLERRLGNRPELTTAFDELQHMQTIIDRILLLARADRRDWIDRRPVPLVGFLEDVFVRWSEVAPRGWQLGPVPDVVVSVDETWLRAAIDALLENAVQHTELRGHVELAAHEEADAVVITVADDGSGIPPAAIGRIFERFARADDSRSRDDGGAGLGLAIVAAIARTHDGSCSAANRREGGAVFELRLPLETRPHAERGPAGSGDELAVAPA